MKYVKPNVITYASMSIPFDDGYTEWSSVTTYDTGDIFMVAADKKNYYCTADGQLNVIPNENSGEGGVYVSEPMNAYAMLDYTSSKRTEALAAGDTISFTFDAKHIDNISLFGLDADYVSVTVEDNVLPQTIFSGSDAMDHQDLEGMTEYLFNPMERFDKVSFDFPMYADVEVTIEISNQYDTAKCAAVVMGREMGAGVSLYGGTVGVKSFSKKQRDDVWGNVVFKKGNTFAVMDVPVYVKEGQFDITQSRLEKVDAEPIVFIGDETKTKRVMLIFGFYLDLEIPIRAAGSKYTLRIESVVA